MLAFEGDIEDVFMQSFEISYQDVFGSTITHDLKENGSKVMVSAANRQVRDVVDLGIVVNVKISSPHSL